MKGFDIDFLFFGIPLVILFGKGILNRTGTWSASQWYGFLFKLAICAVLALGPTSLGHPGLDASWPPPARMFYDVMQVILTVVGIIYGMWLVGDFAGTAPPARVVNGFLLTFVALFLGFGCALWLQRVTGIPYYKTATVILGVYCVGLGAVLPEWVEYSWMYKATSGIISERGTRIFYAAVGFLLIGIGALGHVSLFR